MCHRRMKCVEQEVLTHRTAVEAHYADAVALPRCSSLLYQRTHMVSVEPRVLSSKAPAIRISIAGRVDDRGYQMARVIGRALVTANTHVSLELVPLMETQWEDFVRVTASVRAVVARVWRRCILGAEIAPRAVYMFASLPRPCCRCGGVGCQQISDGV